MKQITLRLLSAVAGAVVIGACGGRSISSQPASAPTAAVAPTSTVPAAGPSPGSAAPSPAAPASASPAPAAAAASPAAVQKVNANTASVAELQRAFEAAGISNAARWAREVEEYRPYPTDDPSFAKLRRELAKYNPGPGVVDQIVATLAL